MLFIFCFTIATMRISILVLAPMLVLLLGAHADGNSALYPPGLQPLINRANTLLSLGQFNDAAKGYSEAIGMFLTLSSLSSTLKCNPNRVQINLQLTTYSTTNALLRISRFLGTVLP